MKPPGSDRCHERADGVNAVIVAAHWPADASGGIEM